MMDVKRTSIELPTNTLIKIKAMAVKKGTTQNKIINELINKGFKSTESETKEPKKKIPEYLIANKNRKPDPEKHEKMAGFIKNVEPFNAVELIKEARSE